MGAKIGIVLLVIAALVSGGVVVSDLVDTGPAAAAGVDPGRLTPEERIVLWETKVQADPSDYISRTHLTVSIMAYARESGDHPVYDRAPGVIEEALAINPRYLPARTAEAGLLHSMHRFPEALAAADSVLGDDPDALDALAVRGDAHLELGHRIEARADYERLAAEVRSGPTVLRLARLALLEGRPTAVDLADEARTLAETVGVTPVEAAFYRTQTASMALRQGDLERGRFEIERALEHAPDWPIALGIRAELEVASGNTEAGIADYRAAIELLPEPVWLGKLALLTGEQALVDQALASADPELDRQMIITVSLDHGRDLEAAYELAKGEAALRPTPDILRNLARAADATDRPREAEAARTQARAWTT